MRPTAQEVTAMEELLPTVSGPVRPHREAPGLVGRPGGGEGNWVSAFIMVSSGRTRLITGKQA